MLLKSVNICPSNHKYKKGDFWDTVYKFELQETR